MKKHKICPICEEGALYRYVISPIGISINICDECDSLWQEGTDITPENSINYSDFMKKNHLKPTWNREMYKIPLYES